MFSNKNIVKYCAKYFVVLSVGAYVYNLCTNLINILKSDVTKLVNNTKIQNKENE